MFGLMRAGGCSLSKENRYRRASTYCGTCKSIGRLYGQAPRLALNHDTVFLGELLLAISGNTLPAGFVPRRCAQLPRADSIPLPLQFAAAANVVLAEFVVDDRIADNSRGWLAARLFLNRPANQARRRLAGWEFPVDSLGQIAREQAVREASPAPAGIDSLAFFSDPTARLTGLFFAHGARVCGASDPVAAALARLGESFGRLVYVLDALVDRAADARTGAFNALAAGQVSLAEAVARILTWRREILDALRALPLPADIRAPFANRVRLSVDRALDRAQIPPEYAPRSLKLAAPETSPGASSPETEPEETRPNAPQTDVPQTDDAPGAPAHSDDATYLAPPIPRRRGGSTSWCVCDGCDACDCCCTISWCSDHGCSGCACCGDHGLNCCGGCDGCDGCDCCSGCDCK